MQKLDENHPLRVEASREHSHRHGLKALQSFVLPLCIAALGVATPELWTAYLWWVAVPWAAIIVVSAITWWNAYPVEYSTLTLTVANSDLAFERDELLRRLEEAEKWVFHSYASSALRTMTAEYIRKGINSVEDLQEAIGEMLAPLYLNGGEVLGIGASEKWTFGVFLYSRKLDELVPLWREKSRNHPSKGAPRSWGRGQGHVGKSFVDRKPIVTGDGTHPDVIQLCGAPAGRERPYDLDVYRSFASIPVGPSSADGMPYGVLVGTSDKKDRFDQDSAILLMHYADSLGVLLSLAKLDCDRLIGSREDGDDEREQEHGQEGGNGI